MLGRCDSGEEVGGDVCEENVDGFRVCGRWGGRNEPRDDVLEFKTIFAAELAVRF